MTASLIFDVGDDWTHPARFVESDQDSCWRQSLPPWHLVAICCSCEGRANVPQIVPGLQIEELEKLEAVASVQSPTSDRACAGHTSGRVGCCARTGHAETSSLKLIAIDQRRKKSSRTSLQWSTRASHFVCCQRIQRYPRQRSCLGCSCSIGSLEDATPTAHLELNPKGVIELTTRSY